MGTISPISPAAGAIRLLGLTGLAYMVVGKVGRGVLNLLAWQDRIRDRGRLASLDQRLLQDIGLSRADIDREISKPFWQG